MGAQFVVTATLVRLLGVDAYGVYAILGGFVGYVVIADLGVSDGITKLLAEISLEDDQERASDLINTGFTFQVSVGLLGLGFFVLVSGETADMLRVPELREAARQATVLAGLGFLASSIAGGMHAALCGLQQHHLAAAVDGCVSVLLAAGMLLLATLNGGLVGAVSFTVASAAVALAAKAFLVRLALPGWHCRVGFSRKTIRELVEFSGFVFVSRLSETFAKYIVRIVLGGLMGAAAAGYWTVAQRAAGAVSSLLSSGAVVLMPFASEAATRGEMEGIRRLLIGLSGGFFALFTAGCFGLVVVGRPLLTIWVGPEIAEAAYPLLFWLCLAGSLGSLTTVAYQVAIGLGYTRLRAHFSVLALGLGVFLVPAGAVFGGAVGAAQALILTSFLPGLAFVVLFSTRHAELPVNKLIRAEAGGLLGGVVVLGVVAAAAFWRRHPLDVGFLTSASLAVCLLAGVVFMRDQSDNLSRLWRAMRFPRT